MNNKMEQTIRENKLQQATELIETTALQVRNGYNSSINKLNTQLRAIGLGIPQRYLRQLRNLGDDRSDFFDEITNKIISVPNKDK